MTNYRRARVAGGTYFFTVNLALRSGPLLVDHVQLLRTAVRDVRVRHSFIVDAMFVLPDHLHSIFTLPPGDSDFALRWRLIKSAFSRRAPPGELRTISHQAKGERGIWQRRYWEHLIRSEADLNSHIDYIHMNPVRHGYVSRVADWPHSSFHRYVKAGTLAADWAGDTKAEYGSHGEPE